MEFSFGCDYRAGAYLDPGVTASSKRPSTDSFEGKFRGKDVFLHLCLEPPEDTEATEILDLRGDGGPILRDKDC